MLTDDEGKGSEDGLMMVVVSLLIPPLLINHIIRYLMKLLKVFSLACGQGKTGPFVMSSGRADATRFGQLGPIQLSDILGFENEVK